MKKKISLLLNNLLIFFSIPGFLIALLGTLLLKENPRFLILHNRHHDGIPISNLIGRVQTQANEFIY